MSADSAPSLADLEPRRRRRLLLATLARSVVTPAILLVLYYTLPLDQPLDGSHAVWFVLGFVVFAAAVSWQVHSITHSVQPQLRAIEALAVVVPVFLLMFAGAYYLLSAGQPDAFPESLGRTDALYFTVTVFATVGFGDIAPTTETSRVLVMFQMIGDLVLVGLVAKLIVGAVNIGISRIASGTTPPGKH
ncbi:potassium channel family protein [Streptomyces sp. NPDC051976]|uniref:potassium channel family protein n=1 Tax=Streptomyces sp. NPDC051976 TaxID=3154947 RepID=UPI003442B64B